MMHNRLRFGTGVLLLTLLAAPLPAQDKDAPKKEIAQPGAAVLDEYRQFFKKPETADDYWKALQFEIDVGQYSVAAQLLRGLLAKPPTEDELLQLEAKYGMAGFLRLRTLPPLRDQGQAVPRWSENDKVQKQALADIEELINLVTAAVKTKLADRDRILKFVKALSGEPEEAGFALKELFFYRALAVPPLIEEMRTASFEERRALRKALVKLSADVIPPLTAALDSNDADLILDLLTVFKERGAKEVVPYLWYLSVSPTQSELVREKATATLAYFLNVERSQLPPARVALTREAERYYQHQVRFVDPKAVKVWRWDKTGIVQGWPGAATVSASKAEEYYGLYFARQALALDSAYQPAQEVLLSLALDKTLENADLAQSLAKVSPAVHDLLASIDPAVLNAVLERAMTDRRSTVVLGCVRALGERLEINASKPSGRGEPTLVRALYYGDKRVQMAAAESLLHLPKPASSQASQRILEILSRNLAVAGQASVRPKAIVASADANSRQRLAESVRDAGYEPVPLSSGRDVFRRLNAANDISAIVAESTLPDPGLASFIAQLRADVNASRLPFLLVAVPDTVESRDALAQYREERDRMQFLVTTIKPYRRARLDLKITYEKDRERLLKASSFASEEERQTELILLSRRYQEDLSNLVRQNPEPAIMDRTAQDLEQRLQSLSDKYQIESRRREEALKRWLERYPTVAVVSSAYLDDPKKLQARLQGEEGQTEIKPLTEAEQKEYIEKSIHYFALMARGELTGYDYSAASESIYNALRGTKLSEAGQLDALVAVGALSTPASQAVLAGVVLDEGRALPLRGRATEVLVKNIQQNSVLINQDQALRLLKLYEAAALNPDWKDFRSQLAVLQGSLRPGARTSGDRLREFQPPLPVAPPAPNP